MTRKEMMETFTTYAQAELFIASTLQGKKSAKITRTIKADGTTLYNVVWKVTVASQNPRDAKVKKKYIPYDKEEGTKAHFLVDCKNDTVTDIVVEILEKHGLDTFSTESDLPEGTLVYALDENYWSIGDFKLQFEGAYAEIKEALRNIK